MAARPNRTVIDLTPIPWSVIQDIAHGMGWLEGTNIEPYLKQMRRCSAYELFEKFLHWNGIINYTSTILTAWESIRTGAGYGKPPFDL